MKGLWRKLKDRHGQSLVEYALILALVAIVVITALTALGGKVEFAVERLYDETPVENRPEQLVAVGQDDKVVLIVARKLQAAQRQHCPAHVEYDSAKRPGHLAKLPLHLEILQELLGDIEGPALRLEEA